VRFGIISDIHANSEALIAVLGALDGLGVDSILCLGDIVGYGPDPDICVEKVLKRSAAVVRGNHDKAAAGLLDLAWFNRMARQAALWTRGAMNPANLRLVRDLPQGPREVGEGVLICHGTPYDEDEYLMESRAATRSYAYLDENHPDVRICLHGHTHQPIVIARRPGEKPQVHVWKERTDLEPGVTYLINPGSVGQPRDGIELASFGILDTVGRAYKNLRAAYPISDTEKKILSAGLPAELAYRLEHGR